MEMKIKRSPRFKRFQMRKLVRVAVRTMIW